MCITVLGGELAVPCYLQSATVGLNVAGGFLRGKQAFARSVDTKVLCNVILSTVSGWEHSSTKRNLPCAARKPGGVDCRVSHRRVLLRKYTRFLYALISERKRNGL